MIKHRKGMIKERKAKSVEWIKFVELTGMDTSNDFNAFNQRTDLSV